MTRISTSLTDLLGVEIPLAVPPMTFACGVDLAAQVASAGGSGFYPTAFKSPEGIVEDLNAIRKILSLSSDAPLRIGVGFLGWILDTQSVSVDVLRACLEQRVQSVWLAFGDDLGKWVEYIRQYDQGRNVAHKTVTWVIVNSVAEAERAAHEWKADVLVVQGIEAGGHGQSKALPLMTLLPLVKQAIPNGPPLVAAGGISTGGHVAAALSLGADGCVLGTRYLTTVESIYTRNQKNAVLSATSSVRTHAFDEARGLDSWPAGINGRALHNKTVEEAASDIPLAERQRRYAEAFKNDDVSRSAIWAGASVGMVNDEIGAADLTRAINAEAIAHLEKASTFLATV